MNQIASSQESIDALTTSLINSLQNKASNNTDLNAAMNTLNQIKQITENAGGPEKIVDSITSGLERAVAGEDSSRRIRMAVRITFKSVCTPPDDGSTRRSSAG